MEGKTIIFDRETAGMGRGDLKRAVYELIDKALEASPEALAFRLYAEKGGTGRRVTIAPADVAIMPHKTDCKQLLILSVTPDQIRTDPGFFLRYLCRKIRRPALLW